MLHRPIEPTAGSDNVGYLWRLYPYLVVDLDSGIEAWMSDLGVGPWTKLVNITLEATYRGEPTTVALDLGLAYRGDVQVELIQPRNDARHRTDSTFARGASACTTSRTSRRTSTRTLSTPSLAGSRSRSTFGCLGPGATCICRRHRVDSATDKELRG